MALHLSGLTQLDLGFLEGFLFELRVVDDDVRVDVGAADDVGWHELRVVVHTIACFDTV